MLAARALVQALVQALGRDLSSAGTDLPALTVSARAATEQRRSSLANTKSAKKAIRVAERRRIHNKPIRSETRTYYRKANAAIGSADAAATDEAILLAISALDKAAHKKIIHPNNAARRKSRLMARLNRARATSQTA